MYASQFMTQIIPLPCPFVLNLERSVERKWKKYKNLNILRERNKRAFEMKKKLYSKFLKAYHLIKK